MKTLTKTSLDAMAKLLPELDEDAQRCIVGGTGSCSGSTGSVPVAPTGYTFEQMNSMMDDGSWTGGLVDGYGYFGEMITVTGSYCITGAHPDDVVEKSWFVRLLTSANTTPTSFLPEENIQAYQDFTAPFGEMVAEGVKSTFDKVVGGAVANAMGGSDNNGGDIYVSHAVNDPTYKTMNIISDELLGLGGDTPKALTGISWGLAYEYIWKDLIEQGNNAAAEMNASMKDFSFWGRYYGQ